MRHGPIDCAFILQDGLGFPVLTLNAEGRVSDVCDLAPGYIRSIAPYQPGKPISELALELAARAFLAPGLEAIYSQHAFAVYPLSTQAAGASGIEVPAREFAHDLAAMLKALTPRTRLCFLANPNN